MTGSKQGDAKPALQHASVTPADSEVREDKLSSGAPTPPLSDSDNVELIDAHLSKAFGARGAVFQEIVSEGVPLDVLVFPPDSERDFYVFASAGMSAQAMKFPAGVPAEEFARAELMIALPRDWGEQVVLSMNASTTQDAQDSFWPIAVLKWLARYPHLAQTWLGPGHTVPNPDKAAYCQDSRMNGAILAESSLMPEDQQRLRLPSGEYLNFYGVVFLFPEEMDLKLEKGSTELMARLLRQHSHPELLNLGRRSVVRKNPILKMFLGD